MIIFHEGMPRSGKSYASTKDHIVPALVKGRTIYARLDGINYVQLAELAGITEARCRELLHEMTEEQMPKIWELPIPKDSLVVIDELQNYWPQNRAPLSPPMMKFIAEHGHHGWDILCMGQLLKDCHRNWINRTNRKVQFVKKDMLGKPTEYKWIMYTGRPDKNGQVKFERVSAGDGTYEEKYFGCYASHSDGTENAETYADERANVFKTAAFRKWIPLAVIAALIGVAYLVYLFKGGLVETAKPKSASHASLVQPVSVTETTTTTGPNQAPVTVVKTSAVPGQEPAKQVATDRGEWDFPDVLSDLSKDNRLRLAAYIRSASHVRVVVEVRDSGGKIVEQFTGPELETLGWHVLADSHGHMLVLARPGKRLVVTAWPLDEPDGKVGKDREQLIRETGKREAVVTQESPVT